ncbi:unnamed protein product [Ranitomeya imitator]|uniref:ribonuclease H n=1 Tax=Ranitomeya imitator TaxID=111125 RepID=A0ABN9M8Y0_9NEOB|nr:unnamed protein product [Ranitomeya imitator]
MSFLRVKDTLVIPYLDDLLIVGKDPLQCEQRLREVVISLQSLGWLVNWEKSRLQPVKCQKFLGLLLDSADQICKLPEDKKFSIVDKLSGSHTRVFSDNTTAVAYLNHQGGTRSDRLRELASDIMELAEGHLLSLSAVHIRGTDNFRADFLSRHTLHQGEWMLNRKIFKMITAQWGIPQIDLFATRANRQVRAFASLNREDKPDILDALQVPWTFDLAYAFPPWNLLPLGKTKGAGVTKNTLSRWIREAIILAYKAGGKDPPMHHGNQGKHRVTKRGPALSYPMFTLVTSEDIAGSSDQNEGTNLPPMAAPMLQAGQTPGGTPGLRSFPLKAKVKFPVFTLLVIYHLAPFSLPFPFNWRGYNESTDAPCAKRKRYEAVHSLKLSRSHVDWHSVDEVYLYSDATTSKIARTVTQKLGFSKASSSGTRLHRGYVEEATYEDKPVDTTHIVFVVHGIGQKMDQGRIIKNTAMMRETARKIEEKHFSNQTSEHVEFLPVEWRSKLALDGDTVDSITPDKVRGIRDMLNSSAMDIMYYTSPLYRDELVKGLLQELNRLYNLFCSRNPEFEDRGGKVSIVSHSLGCVITFDIMTGWNPVHVCEQLDQEETEDQWISYEEQHLLRELCLTKQRLKELEDRLNGLNSSNTPVENFFCMGSPLAVFLALRGIRPGNRGTQDHILPRAICNRLFNVFHPADPVAYRLEPLILKHYSNIAPVQIHSSNTTNPIPYKHLRPCLINPSKDTTSMSDTESIPSPSTSPVLPRRHYGESITNIGKASILGAASIGKGLGGMLFSRFARSSATTSQGCEVKDSADGEDKKSAQSQSTAASQTIPHSISGSLDTVDLENRIDFELREGLVESRYWSAMTSHTAYWSSMDVALFLLTFLYKDGQIDEEDKLGVDEL